MDKTTYLKLECPRCHSTAHAKVNKRVNKFLIYRCPGCESNVVYYENHVDILSDGFVRYLTKGKNLTFCGDTSFQKKLPSNKNIRDEEITPDRIIDFRILLNTEMNFDKFLKKI